MSQDIGPEARALRTETAELLHELNAIRIEHMRQQSHSPFKPTMRAIGLANDVRRHFEKLLALAPNYETARVGRQLIARLSHNVSVAA